MSHLVGKPTMWFPTRFDTNRPVQSQKRARSLKFRIKVEEELYFPSSENKGADQLRGYREADLRLCFRLCRLLVFSWGGSYNIQYCLLKYALPKHNGSIRPKGTLSKHLFAQVWTYLNRVMRKSDFCLCKNKDAFVFATPIVQCLFYL